MLLPGVGVAEPGDLVQPRGGTEVEDLGMGRGQQLPRVAPGVAIARVAADEDPGLSGSIILLVDWVLQTEGPVTKSEFFAMNI